MNTDTLTIREKRLMARRRKLRDLYEAGATVREMAAALNVTTQAVYQMLQTLGLPSPTQKEAS